MGRRFFSSTFCRTVDAFLLHREGKRIEDYLAQLRRQDPLLCLSDFVTKIVEEMSRSR